MKKIFLFLLFFLTTLSAWAYQALSHEQMLAKAHELMDLNVRVQNIKKKNSIFKHPSYVDHNSYQSIRYHQVYVKDKKEWEVIGGGVDLHYSHIKSKWIFSNQLLDWSNGLGFESLINESEIKNIITNYFQLKKSINNEDFILRKKILVQQGIAKLIYWMEIKGRAFEGISTDKRPAPRVLAINATSGEIIYDFSSLRHIDELPRIQVKNASLNSKIVSGADKSKDESQLKLIYPEVCQLLPPGKKANLEPLLLQPNYCPNSYDRNSSASDVDGSSKRAFENMEIILSYYFNEHKQWGYDNDLSSANPIVSIVHVGSKLDNAYWDPDLKVMAYGDGSGDGTKGTLDYTLALDIAGHEFTHAISNHTANFIYSGEPGALDEAFADIFGVLISRSQNKFESWSIGAKLFANPEASDELSLRSLSNPTKYKTSAIVNNKTIQVPFPDKYSQRLAKDERCIDKNDQCEVHANSMIWSYNAYLISQGLQSLGIKSQEADKKVGQLFFITLSHHLQQDTNFKQAATELQKVCSAILESNECLKVNEALQKTELLD